MRKQTRFACSEQAQETLALLMLLALTGKKVEKGSVCSAKESFTEIRTRITQRRFLH